MRLSICHSFYIIYESTSYIHCFCSFPNVSSLLQLVFSSILHLLSPSVSCLHLLSSHFSFHLLSSTFLSIYFLPLFSPSILFKNYHYPRQDEGGIEGFAVEYWSPPPAWKDNQQYIGGTLAGFNASFLADFAAARVVDLHYLAANGLNVTWWGLQNEPYYSVDADREAAFAEPPRPLQVSERRISTVHPGESQQYIPQETAGQFCAAGRVSQTNQSAKVQMHARQKVTGQQCSVAHRDTKAHLARPNKVEAHQGEFQSIACKS